MDTTDIIQVLVNFLRAILAAVIAAFLAWSVCITLEVANWKEYGAVAAAVIASAFYLGGDLWWRRMFEYQVGYKDPLPPRVLQLEIKTQGINGLQNEYLDNVTPETLLKIALLVDNGKNITHDTCSKYFASRPAFTDFQDSLVHERWAEWVSSKSRQSGIRLTPTGKERFANLLTQHGGIEKNGADSRNTHAHKPLPAGEGWRDLP